MKYWPSVDQGYVFQSTPPQMPLVPFICRDLVNTSLIRKPNAIKQAKHCLQQLQKWSYLLCKPHDYQMLLDIWTQPDTDYKWVSLWHLCNAPDHKAEVMIHYLHKHSPLDSHYILLLHPVTTVRQHRLPLPLGVYGSSNLADTLYRQFHSGWEVLQHYSWWVAWIEIHKSVLSLHWGIVHMIPLKIK